MSGDAEKKRGFLGRFFGRDAPKPEPEPAPKPEPVVQPEPTPEVVHEPGPMPPPSAAPPAPDEPSSATAASATAVATAPDISHDATPPLREPRAVDAARHENPQPEPAKKGWLARLKDGLAKTSSKLTEGIAAVFTKRKLDADSLQDLEDLLIQADLGLETSMRITEALSKGRYQKGISADEVRSILADEVERVLTPVARPLQVDGSRKPHVVLVVGVNGTGKTTTIGKLAHRLRGEGKRVMLAAGDTFRAAAIEQLGIWGERTGAKVIARKVGADASGLAFAALTEARADGYDVLLVDTAGRLQNKAALMDELEKVVRVIKKVDPTAPHDVLLVLDATTGQNAMSQVEVFRERAGVTGLVMTKLDGTARGGILVAISAKHAIPVHAIGVGEQVEDLQPFEPADFARAIAGS